MSENSVYNNIKRFTSGLNTAQKLLSMKLDKEDALDEVELDESDVVWSTDDNHETENLSDDKTTSKPIPRVLKSRIAGSHSQRIAGLEQMTSGLTVALSENPHTLRRSNLSRTGIAIPASASKSRPSEEFSGRYHRSAPVNVPLWSKSFPKEQGRVWRGEGLGDDEEKEEERLPPHEILARQQAREHFSTFSMCEGRGRTLKGSDITRVRDAIWRQIGFDG